MNLRKSIILLTSFVAQNIWETKNGEIYVNNTIPYRIRGVNWHGIETNCKVPHGLWLNKVSFYLDILNANKFNSVRLPVSYEVMNNLDQPVLQSCLTSNPELEHLSVGDFLDYFMDTLRVRNITLLVDLHTIQGRITQYPWTNSVSFNATKSAWVNFLKRYGTKVFGVELKNEPHNECQLDEFIHWCVSTIESIERETSFNGLYFISGVQYTFKDGSFNTTWDGITGDKQGSHFPGTNYGDLRETSDLANPNIPLNRIIFSPHIYAPDIEDAENSINWESQFGFIKRKNWIFKDIPIIFTELGGKLDGPDYDYYLEFGNWARENRLINGMYWYTLPPTSVSTGGLMVGDQWNKIDSRKMEYIKAFIPDPTI